MTLPNVTILAYCEDMIPILAEIVLDCGLDREITIIENMELPKGLLPIDVPGITYEWIWKTDWQPTGQQHLVLSVVQPPSKKKVFQEFLEWGNLDEQQYLNLIHPTSFVAKNVQLEGGLILEPLSVISSHTSIGFGATIRRGVNIGHHGSIGRFVSINPGVSVGGKVKIGDGVTLGIGAVVLDNIEIGENSFIGAGSVVTRSIPPGVIAYGSPCKVVRKIGS